MGYAKDAKLAGILEKVSYHAVYDDSIMDALVFARENGFAGVQAAVEAPHLSFENMNDEQCDEIASYCDEHGLTLSLHGPDFGTSLFETSRRLQAGIFQYIAAMYKAAERMGAKLVVLHVGQMPSFRTDTSPDNTVPSRDLVCLAETFSGNLRRAIDLAAGRFLLCVENFGLNEIALEGLNAYLGDNGIFLCWDLVKGRNDTTVQKFYWENIEHVRQVHLHDVRDGRSHRVIGSGTFDFFHFLPALNEVNVLDYCIEVRPRDKAAESLDNLRQMLRGHSPSCGGV